MKEPYAPSITQLPRNDMARFARAFLFTQFGMLTKV